MSDPIEDVSRIPEHLLWLDYEGEDRDRARRGAVLALMAVGIEFPSAEDFVSAFVTVDDYVARGLEGIQKPPAAVTAIKGGKP